MDSCVYLESHYDSSVKGGLERGVPKTSKEKMLFQQLRCSMRV